MSSDTPPDWRPHCPSQAKQASSLFVRLRHRVPASSVGSRSVSVTQNQTPFRRGSASWRRPGALRATSTAVRQEPLDQQEKKQSQTRTIFREQIPNGRACGSGAGAGLGSWGIFGANFPRGVDQSDLDRWESDPWRARETRAAPRFKGKSQHNANVPQSTNDHPRVRISLLELWTAVAFLKSDRPTNARR